jgi:bis(5'-adenosyl)-triphosphatase
VLVIPRKPYARLADLPREEVSELFESVQTISSKVQELVKASACTISIQDGADAVSKF